LSDLKPTLVLYALCHQFLTLVVEGDELYTKVKKRFPGGRSKVDYRTDGTLRLRRQSMDATHVGAYDSSSSCLRSPHPICDDAWAMALG
jgi:hypothetical protein